MAQVEQMDIDDIESEFDNKENTFHHSNVLSRTPCTEKGYEELDVSELNMKLRYSITPSASPMSKSFTGPCLDRISNPVEDNMNTTVGIDNGSLTRSLNSALTKNESLVKLKSLPLQTISSDSFVDTNRNLSSRRLLEATNDDIKISVSNSNDVDENLSLPSTCSSVTDTPEATTPTKEIPKPEGSPILRGLKSVLSMFRSSQSPILLTDDKTPKREISASVDSQDTSLRVQNLASTPVAAIKQKEISRSSPLKESIVFNEDLERELQWKDETTIIFKDEKIPVHKLLFLNSGTPGVSNNTQHLNTTVEYMDISCDNSVVVEKSTTEVDPNNEAVNSEVTVAVESDSEFLDCETTFPKNESYVTDYKATEIKNESQMNTHVIRDVSDDFSTTNKSEYGEVLDNSLCVQSGCTNIYSSDLTSEKMAYVVSQIDSNIQSTDTGSSAKINEFSSQTEGINYCMSVQSLEQTERITDFNSILEGQSHLTSVRLTGQTPEKNISQIEANSDCASMALSDQTSERVADFNSQTKGITHCMSVKSTKQTLEGNNELTSILEAHPSCISVHQISERITDFSSQKEEKNLINMESSDQITKTSILQIEGNMDCAILDFSDQTSERVIELHSQVEGNNYHTNVEAPEQTSEKSIEQIERNIVYASVVEDNTHNINVVSLDQTSEIMSKFSSEIEGNNYHTSIGFSDQTSEKNTDFNSKEESVACLIECTSNFLKSEISHCTNVTNECGNSLMNRNKIKNLQNLPTVKEVLQQKDQIIPKSVVEKVSNNSKCYEDSIYPIANLPDVYAQTLNDNDNSKDVSDMQCKAIKTNKYIVNDDMAISENIRDDFTSKSETINTDTINVIESVPNTQSNNVLNVSEIKFNSIIPIDTCSELITDDKKFTESMHTSDDLAKITSVGLIMDNKLNIDSFVKLAQHADVSTNDTSSENMQVDSKTMDIPNHGNHYDQRFSSQVQISEVHKDVIPPEITLIEESDKNFAPVSDIPSSVNNVLTVVNDSDIPEMISPTDIPLPDDEVIEQNIVESINIVNKETDTTAVVTFEICERSSDGDVNNLNKLAAQIKDHTKRETTENSQININLKHDIDVIENAEVINKYITEAQNDSIQNQDKIIETDMAMTHENIEHSKIINTSNNGLEDEQEDICKNQCTSGIEGVPNSINTENKILDETMGNDIEASRFVQKKDASLMEIDFTNSEEITQVNDDDIPLHIKSATRVEDIVEIITSANNSPYVSVVNLALKSEDTHQVDIPCPTNTKIVSSPPVSPTIVSKGYNYNFDDMDDPFATKTKIRMSPTPTSDSADQYSVEFNKEVKMLEVPKKNGNRRKSQPDTKRPAPKKNVNSTFSAKLTGKKNITEKVTKQTVNAAGDKVINDLSPIVKEKILNKPDNSTTVLTQYHICNDNTINAEDIVTTSLNLDSKDTSDEIRLVDKEKAQAPVLSNNKSTSSSEQYFSLGSLETSSGESEGIINRVKNVFNLPEIDDVNFNPFATKSKMRMSPPPSNGHLSHPIENTHDTASSSFVLQEQSVDNTTTAKDLTFDKNITKDLSPNISQATCSSKNTNDDDTTVREILTEDEDTIEGPFLEAEEIKDSEKLSHVDADPDMINFDEISQDKDENMENGELFIDADAFEFLLNQKSTTVLDSGKESLFLKFDPLMAKRVSSDGVLTALSKVQKRQSTPNKVTKPMQYDFTPVVSSANDKENHGQNEEYSEDISSIMTKPMMVVNPAVNSIVTQRRSTGTPKLNRRSLTFTSPAMAVIDRLLSLSGNSSHLDRDTSIPNVSREYTETDLAITQLRELLAEKEINVHNLRSESKELKNRLAALESQVRNLETESTDRLNKIKELSDRLSEKTKINKSMATVVEEYERTIASLIAETEQDKKRNAEERLRLIKERDEQTAHLTSMEVSFSDLHSKYEKSKQIILSCKANEDMYKKSIKEFEENFSKMQNNYELLKQHATSKLNHANQELEKMNRTHEAEVVKLHAMIKRKELHITSLEETLAQKTKANEELTAICDELINKVA